MKLSTLLSALTTLACVGATDRHETPGEQLRDLQTMFDGDRLFCTLYMRHSLPLAHGSQDIETLRCETDDNHMYTVTNVPTDCFQETPFVSGSIRMSVLSSYVYDSNYINMTAGDAQILESNVANRLADMNMNRTLIAIRVIDSGGIGPTLSQQYFANKIFGTAGDVLNLSSGYAQCSGNLLQFTPGAYSEATDGVMDLTLSSSTDGLSIDDVEDLAKTAIFGLSGFTPGDYDHIMFIYSPSVNTVAYAYVNWKYSFFQDTWATSPSVLMHEIAHNLGYAHSGDNGNEYGDKSGMMGYSYKNDELPAMCFNAAKSWYFGWYNTHHVEINPLNLVDNVELKLIGINDFLNGESSSIHTTIVHITGGSEELFMMYNKREGVNSGTQTGANKVNIVAQNNKGAQSWLRAKLSINEEYTVMNFGGVTGQLVVKVCETINGTPDVARTLVYVDSVQSLSCTPATPQPTPITTSNPTPEPTSNPTSNPTTNPTHQPTPNPTPNPTTNPTHQPTPIPTSNPTSNPTPQPTSNPTTNPTHQPTSNPTTNPIPQPTYELTPQPTSDPTPQPTLNPTPQPTSNPTSNPTPQPTSNPTTNPTHQPTPIPTPNPTTNPTHQPTPELTPQPASDPTPQPTPNPTHQPTSKPATDPTHQPTPIPTPNPTSNPTHQPTSNPTHQPTSNPTHQPTPQPTHQPIPIPTTRPTPIPIPQPTPEPTPNPTTNLTPQPTSIPKNQPTPKCNNNEQLLLIQIKTKGNNEERRFNLGQRRSKYQRKIKTRFRIIMSAKKLIKNEVNKFYKCVKTQRHCYKLKVVDSEANGIKSGHIKMFRDGERIYMNHFEEFEEGRITQKFGKC